MHESLQLMRDEIEMQSELLRAGVGDVKAQLEAQVPDEVARQADRIYITGCGDSFHAGLATRLAFEEYTGVVTEPLQALEFSRYEADFVTEDTVVFGISNSGEVARSLEAVMAGKRGGAFTVGVTRDDESRLAEAADAVLHIDIPSVVGKAPGTRSYLGSLVGLYLGAIILGDRQGTLAQAAAAEAELKACADAVDATIDLAEEAVEEYVDGISADEKFHLVGGGPNFATAQFGSMKLLEGCGVDSIPQGLEEWAHTQYFLTQPGVSVIFIVPPGRSHDRALEVMEAVEVVGGTTVAVCEQGDDEVVERADVVWPVAAGIDEKLSPAVYKVPIELFAYHLGVKMDAAPLDFDGRPEKKEENFRQIFHSEIVEG